LQGHRRLGALKHISENPDSYNASIYEISKKIDCVVFGGLSRNVAESIIMDHGSEKPLRRSELVNCIYRLFYGGHNATEIMTRLAMPLSSAFGVSPAKVDELVGCTDESSRLILIRAMFQNKVNNYIVKATQAGPFVAEQVLRHFKAEDNLLGEDEPLLFNASNPSINELMKAVKEDKKIGQWDNIRDCYLNEEGKPIIDGGGPNSVEKLKELIHDHFNPSAPKAKPPRMMTRSDVKSRQDAFKSKGFKTALEMVRQGDTDANTMEIDAQAYKLERIESVARVVLDCGGTKTKVLNGVLGAMDSVANFQKALIEQCSPEVAKKAKDAIEKAISGNK
jgi:hypothetical protein